MKNARLLVGYVAGAHGIGGTLRVRLHDPDSPALAPKATIDLLRDDAHVARHTIAHVADTPKRGELRVTLVGVNDREAAEALRGTAIAIDRTALPALSDDEYYLADTIGASVQRLRADGSREDLGRIIGIMSNGPQDLFEIEWTDDRGAVHAWLLPALAQFVRDVDDDRVLVDVPPGFLPEALERDA